MLPKKGSRRVTVEGTIYRWRESHGHKHFELRLEHFEKPGQLLCVFFRYLHLDAEAPAHVYRPIMTHRVLSAAVECGLRGGWRPEVPGRLVTVDANASAELVSAYDYRYSKWTINSGDRYL